MMLTILSGVHPIVGEAVISEGFKNDTTIREYQERMKKRGVNYAMM
jgi:hypothetical protein